MHKKHFILSDTFCLNIKRIYIYCLRNVSFTREGAVQESDFIKYYGVFAVL